MLRIHSHISAISNATPRAIRYVFFVERIPMYPKLSLEILITKYFHHSLGLTQTHSHFVCAGEAIASEILSYLSYSDGFE